MKKWYMSKTISIGLIEALFGGVILYQEYLVQALNGEMAGWVLLASGLAKVGLRFITTTSVTK